MIDFNKEVLNKDKVLVDFYANWCGPCKMLSPIVDEVAKDIDVVKINIDDNMELAKTYKVMSIPCLMLFKNGELVNKSVGLISKSELIEFINK